MLTYSKHNIETNLRPEFKSLYSIKQQLPDICHFLPSGEEHTFSIWGQRWRQLHGKGEDASPSLKSALQHYPKAVVRFQKIKANEEEIRRAYGYKIIKAKEEQAKAQEEIPARQQNFLTNLHPFPALRNLLFRPGYFSFVYDDITFNRLPTDLLEQLQLQDYGQEKFVIGEYENCDIEWPPEYVIDIALLVAKSLTYEGN